ncbi:hypothetical protein KUC_2783 [Vreelandella boliviensis LC1]|uniref:Uncharacterized protein n=1 Tax=Vreelandella boliviensis LC1 TaxID=1072583 RepID=A0A7U9C0E0_9GAMM|nr:hypothetical protein KUC_2783 [Halomonas boliviensis LC1]
MLASRIVKQPLVKQCANNMQFLLSLAFLQIGFLSLGFLSLESNRLTGLL